MDFQIENVKKYLAEKEEDTDIDKDKLKKRF